MKTRIYTFGFSVLLGIGLLLLSLVWLVSPVYAQDDPDNAQGSTTQDPPTQEEVAEALFSLHFTELMPCPLSGDSEWIELYNPTDYHLTIEDWRVRSASGATRLISGQLPPHEYTVFSWNGFILAQTGSDVILLDHNFDVIDQVSYPECERGLSWSKLGSSWLNTEPTPGLPNQAPTPTPSPPPPSPAPQPSPSPQPTVDPSTQPTTYSHESSHYSDSDLSSLSTPDQSSHLKLGSTTNLTANPIPNNDPILAQSILQNQDFANLMTNLDFWQKRLTLVIPQLAPDKTSDQNLTTDSHLDNTPLISWQQRNVSKTGVLGVIIGGVLILSAGGSLFLP